MQLFLKNTKEKNRWVYTRARLCIMLCIPVLFFFLWSFSASARITQSTSSDGITLQFILPELTISEAGRDNIRYHEAHYAECHFTTEPGNPKVPVTRLMLGIPATATIEAVDVSAAPAETRSGCASCACSIFPMFTHLIRLSGQAMAGLR